jgi:DNA-binding GntR family transcriptional regulator
MKPDVVFKRAYNDALTVLSGLVPGERLPSEEKLGDQLGVSRTTVRKILDQLGRTGLVSGMGRERRLHMSGAVAAPFPETETVSVSAQLENRFMEWILRNDMRPGASIGELQLSRQFGVGMAGIREFLNRFQRYGLIEKRPNASWRFKGFTTKFALELFEIREMFEVRSALAFAALPKGSPLWAEIEALHQEHLLLLDDIEARFNDFSHLDNRFHRLINQAAPNRFIDSFYDIISMIFHYHYQWSKHNERQRNEVAIEEHLAYIHALRARDLKAIEIACRTHLMSARETLIRSTSE